MTIAKHPDGRQFYFDDAIPKEAIQASMKHLMMNESAEKQRQAQEEQRRQAEEAQRKQEQAAKEDAERKRQDMEAKRQKAESEGQRKEGMAREDKRHSDHMQMGKAQLQMHAQTASAIEELSKQFESLKDLPARMDALTKAVTMLGQQIGKSTDGLVKVMKSPRKIVNSPKGRPIGMQIEDE